MIDLAIYQRAFTEMQAEFTDAFAEYTKRVRAAQLKFQETISGRTPDPEPEPEPEQEQVAEEQVASSMNEMQEMTGQEATHVYQEMLKNMGQLRNFDE